MYYVDYLYLPIVLMVVIISLCIQFSVPQLLPGYSYWTFHGAKDLEGR